MMFHMGRCGSSVLADLLNQHSKIYWDGEIYFPYIREWRAQKQTASHDSSVNIKPEALKLLKNEMSMAGSNFYGCEVKFHHIKEANLSIPNYIEYISHLNFNNFIILIRRNFLRSIISNRVMYDMEIKKTHIRAAEKTQLQKVKLDIISTGYNGYKKELSEHLKEHEKNFIEIDDLLKGKKVLKLSYEDDISENPQKSYQKICDFLDIIPSNYSVRLGKTNPFKISDLLVNYDEVKEYLSGTNFEWMLYE